MGRKFVLRKGNNIHQVEPEHDIGVLAQKMPLFLKKKGTELYISNTVTLPDFSIQSIMTALEDILRQKPKESLHQ